MCEIWLWFQNAFQDIGSWGGLIFDEVHFERKQGWALSDYRYYTDCLDQMVHQCIWFKTGHHEWYWHIFPKLGSPARRRSTLIITIVWYGHKCGFNVQVLKFERVVSFRREMRRPLESCAGWNFCPLPPRTRKIQTRCAPDGFWEILPAPAHFQPAPAPKTIPTRTTLFRS